MTRTRKPSESRQMQETFHWLPLHDPDVIKRMEQFRNKWTGTTYMAGNRVRGVGCDCAQLIPAFLDFMYRTGSRLPIPRLAPDTGLHNARAALNTVRAVRRGFPSFVVRDGTIEPGDIVLTRASHDWEGPSNPGHAMIAYHRPGTALHAMPESGVCLTTLTVTRGIVRVYRLKGKQSWA